MNTPLPTDEELVRRLPLPLAQLYRRAHNAKTPLERHLTAYYLWEASLKLLASVAVVEYADRPEHDPQLAERLTNLARPSLGHWWEFVRRLVPVLADQGDEPLQSVRDLVLGRSRDDLPRAAGLDAALREALDGQAGGRATVRLTELFDRLVRYRNRELGHGAAGQRPAAFYERMGAALLAGVSEVLGKLDALAGRRLLYVAEVRQVQGAWLVQRYELAGENARRIESLELPHAEAAQLPFAERLHLEAAGALRPLHPLLLYDAEADEALFLNARRGKRRTEYLSYTTGRTVDRPDLGGEQRALLARVLGMDVGEGQAEQWAARSHAEEPPEPAPALPARRTLGEFELLSELGRGGMGVVYRAWQPSLGRQVAVKSLLRPGDAKAEARFRREIRALGRVDHPHVVKVFTSGSDGDQWFYVMELVEGAPLAAVCDRLRGRSGAAVDLRTWQEALSTACEEARKAEKPLTPPPADPANSSPPRTPSSPPLTPSPDQEAHEGWDELLQELAQLPRMPSPHHGAHVLRSAASARRDYVRHIAKLVRQAAEAAHALHEAGVVHRDIKPGNILVTADGGQAVLMDLGLAQLADDLEGRLTRTRQFVGTLRYASPQQVLAVTRLDCRTDVYSLGATLWELLALQPLFGATDNTPTPELMEKIQREEPERLRRHHPGIARDLEAVVHRCLEKDPGRRYQTARELAEDLGRFLDGEAVRARPAGRLDRALKWVRRKPATATAYGLLLLALVLASGGGGAVWLWQRAEDARERSAQASYLRQVDLAYRVYKDKNLARAVALLEDCTPARRDWEWYFVRRLCRGSDQEAFTLTGQVDHRFNVWLSPDGDRLASGPYVSEDRLKQTIKVWQVTTGQEVLTLPESQEWQLAWSVGFSPDGKRLASAYHATVRLWDAANGQETLVLQDPGPVLPQLRGLQARTRPQAHTAPVRNLCFSPDSKRLATASEDKTAKVWDAATGQQILVLRGDIYSLCFSPDSKHLAIALVSGKVEVWDVAARKLRSTFQVETNPVWLDPHAAYLPDGFPHVLTKPIWSICFSPDGKRLASASHAQTALICDALTGRVTHTLTGHEGIIRSLCFSPDGKRLATASEDKTVKLWDVATGQEAITLRGHESSVIAVCFSGDGERLISASADKAVKVWRAARQDTRTKKGQVP